MAAALIAAGISLAAAPSVAATDTNTVRTVPIQPPEQPVDEQQQEDGSTLADMGNLPEVSKDISKLPEAVQRMRAEILEAARSGDISRMQVPIDQSELPPAMGQNTETDIVGFLRSLAGDENGREILAIIVEILESGYAHVEPGTDREAYVWPYFAALPFDALTPEQEVDLFKVITAADRDDMASHAGQYTFYRLGIGPDGTWYFLLSGD
ncbi:hypothetical protein ACKTEK_02275 [Tepidamorphus sp. 3E244]|uniref:hypothetical protein n=1 Tax=Tepidamorphus sp. 3E244 TaxID=3385498 RepID=UPI0038FBF17D